MNAFDRQIRFRVEGIDCASCAEKIDKTVRRLPHISDVSVSVVAGAMTIRHGETVDLDTIARRLGSLGNRTTPSAAKDTTASRAHGPDHAQHLAEHRDLARPERSVPRYDSDPLHGLVARDSRGDGRNRPCNRKRHALARLAGSPIATAGTACVRNPET